MSRLYNILNELTNRATDAVVTQSFRVTVPAQSTYYYNGAQDISKTGYTPVGIDGQINQAAVYFYKNYTNGNTAEFGIASANQTSLSGTIVTLYVTYVKTSLL